jgi:excisionase family DNA binding protein
VNGQDDTLSIGAAAERLGVYRWTVWRMIAEGELDAESTNRGRRLLTRVQLPQPSEDDPSPRSRTARLQERVDRLTHSVECLSEMLLKAERERAELRNELERYSLRGGQGPPLLAEAAPPAPIFRVEPAALSIPARENAPVRHDAPPAAPVAPQPVVDFAPPVESLPQGITGRPNPMTHPASLFLPTRGPAGEEALQPVRNLFKRDERRRSWWQKLPAARG